MGIKEEAGNYLPALSKCSVTDRRCDGRIGQRGVDDTVIRICQSDWKENQAVQGVCFDRGWRAFNNWVSLTSVAGRVIELVFGVHHMFIFVFLCAGPTWTTVLQTFPFLLWCWQEQACSSPRRTGGISKTAACKTPNSVTHLGSHFNQKSNPPGVKGGNKNHWQNADLRKREYKKTLRHRTVKLSRRFTFISREDDVYFGFSQIMLVCIRKLLLVCICMWQRAEWPSNLL